MAPGAVSPAPLPPGTATRPGPVSRETPGGAANAAARKPLYPEWLSARGLKDSAQNRLRFNNEVRPFQNLRNQAPPTVPRGADAEAAANVGSSFPRGDFQRFERGARPSSNVEDVRGGPFASTINSLLARGPEASWEATPEQVAKLNPNDPMTRQLMGSDRSRLRSDVLRNMTTNEFMRWLGEMRRERLEGGWR